MEILESRCSSRGCRPCPAAGLRVAPALHTHCDHVPTRAATPRRIDLESREPLHRLGRRGHDAHRRRSGSAGRTLAQGSGFGNRPCVHVDAQASHLDQLALPGPDGPRLAAGRQPLAHERAPLRRAAGPEQGRRGAAVRRRSGPDLAPQLRRRAAAAGARRCALRARRSALRRPRTRPGTAGRMPEADGRAGAAVLGTDARPRDQEGRAAADHRARQQPARPGDAPRPTEQRADRQGQHPQRRAAGLRTRRPAPAICAATTCGRSARQARRSAAGQGGQRLGDILAQPRGQRSPIGMRAALRRQELYARMQALGAGDPPQALQQRSCRRHRPPPC